MADAMNIPNSGYHLEEILGHFVVIYIQDSTFIGFGMLSIGRKFANIVSQRKQFFRHAYLNTRVIIVILPVLLGN